MLLTGRRCKRQPTILEMGRTPPRTAQGCGCGCRACAWLQDSCCDSWVSLGWVSSLLAACLMSQTLLHRAASALRPLHNAACVSNTSSLSGKHTGREDRGLLLRLLGLLGLGELAPGSLPDEPDTASPGCQRSEAPAQAQWISQASGWATVIIQESKAGSCCNSWAVWGWASLLLAACLMSRTLPHPAASVLRHLRTINLLSLSGKLIGSWV